MLTAQEYVDKYKGKPDKEKPSVFWLNGLDLMQHVLKFDPDNTINEAKHTNSRFELSDAIAEAENEANSENFDDIIENSYVKSKCSVPVLSENDGDLLMDQYLDKSRMPFEDFVRVEVNEEKRAITVFINIHIMSGEINGNDVQMAYEKCYEIAAQCEAEGRPCRIIGVMNGIIYGYKKDADIALFMVLKDYSDPIFPAIWAGIKNNKIANALICCIKKYFIGTTSRSVGCASETYSSVYLMDNYCDPEQDDIITFGRRIKTVKGKHEQYENYQ